MLILSVKLIIQRLDMFQDSDGDVEEASAAPAAAAAAATTLHVEDEVRQHQEQEKEKQERQNGEPPPPASPSKDSAADIGAGDDTVSKHSSSLSAAESGPGAEAAGEDKGQHPPTSASQHHQQQQPPRESGPEPHQGKRSTASGSAELKTTWFNFAAPPKTPISKKIDFTKLGRVYKTDAKQIKCIPRLVGTKILHSPDFKPFNFF